MTNDRRDRINHWKDVVALLVSRDFRGRYQHARIGALWALVSPLLFLTVFYFLFGHVLDLGIENYASFAFIGILVWNWTQSSLMSAVTSMSANPGLVAQPGFPLGTLPVVSVVAAFLNLLIALPLLVILTVIEGVAPTAAYLALPLVVAVQFFFTLALCFVIAALNVALRDVEQILPVLLQLGYYVTPIFYSLSNIPDALQPYFRLNPMVTVITSYRDIVLRGIWPDWASLGMVLFGSLLLLWFGQSYFQRARQSFLEEL
ncbi:ABC transporter permease [Qipengyuania qiaonensis]|uniref:Transport permease protein n=1 Tax=Qipengyuania qiaonensis TaxID=2867240 RepID=A0ABS7JCG0_9SPHN|nr:ABC transporter permease [Qipengyuania qiaonensis]MBX7483645.1 ABC transporter permease [Qipengyuania qiaonensis]